MHVPALTHSQIRGLLGEEICKEKERAIFKQENFAIVYMYTHNLSKHFIGYCKAGITNKNRDH